MATFASSSAYYREATEEYVVDGPLEERQVRALVEGPLQGGGQRFVAMDNADLPGLQAAGVAFMHLPFAGTSTFRDMDRVLQEMDDGLQTPAAVLCMTGTRASVAVACNRVRKEPELSWEDLLAWGTEKNLGWVIKPQWKDFVLGYWARARPRAPLLFRQFFEKESCTYTYLLADADTREAILIDPVVETMQRDVTIIRELGLTLRWVTNTHVHADHITSSGRIKSEFDGCQSVILDVAGAEADVQVADNDKLTFGSRFLHVRSTPGHTNGCTTFVLDDMSMCFTGDALFVRGCGRTDFQQGSAATLWRSVHGKIFSLPPDCIVYPGHDYKGHHSSTVGEERVYNPRLSKPRPEFEQIMNNLNLPNPKKLAVSLPANLKDGIVEEKEGDGEPATGEGNGEPAT